MRKALFFATITLAIAALFFEGFVRMVLPQQEFISWVEDDASLRKRLIAGYATSYPFAGTDFEMQVQINALGMRDREYSADELEADSTTRVLLLGDSFTFAHGVQWQESFDALLEEAFTNSSKNLISLNGGIIGWGTLQQAAYARANFATLRPDMLVLTFCGNDPADDATFLSFKTMQQKGESETFSIPGKLWLYQNSHLYRLVFDRIRVLRHQWRMRAKQDDKPDENAVDAQSGSIISEAEWQRSLGEIRQLHADFLASNPRGHLIIQVTAPWQQDIRMHLKSLDNGESLHYLDLEPLTRHLTEDERSLPYDGHWSRAMHRISAQALAELIGHLRD